MLNKYRSLIVPAVELAGPWDGDRSNAMGFTLGLPGH